MDLSYWHPLPQWNEESIKYLNEFKVESLLKQTIDSITTNKENFPIKMPTEANQCSILKQKINENILTKNINSVYPILHCSILKLYIDFLIYKRNYGAPIEQDYYKKITLKDIVNKILKKRAISNLGFREKYLYFKNKNEISDWEEMEKPNADNSYNYIEERLTYDEVKLSAFLSISSYTYFINKGDRRNIGRYEKNRDIIEDQGIIIGLMGARLNTPNVMEYQEIAINKNQNVEKNGYGTKQKHNLQKLFTNFYEEKCITFDEVVIDENETNGERYTVVDNDTYFDNVMYYKRIAFTIDTLLLEANFRAKAARQLAYVHVVGLGLGAWKLSNHQDLLYMESFAERLKIIGDKLHNISDLCFAYIDVDNCGDYKNGEKFLINNHPNGGIKIHIFNRDPHRKLIGEDAGKLLVVSYAWDGNALPGNEYWHGSLAGSGDPAAACSTQIPEIHNPHINPLVCADNLHIATEDEVYPIAEYQQLINNEYCSK